MDGRVIFLFSNIFKFQSAPWWLPIERVFWRQVKSFFLSFLKNYFWHLSLLWPPNCSACRTWLRHPGAVELPGGSGELERCSDLLSLEGQEAAHRGGVGVGCTWRAARYTVHKMKSHMTHEMSSSICAAIWIDLFEYILTLLQPFGCFDPLILASMKQIDINTSGDPRTNTLELLLISWTCPEQQFRLCLF